MECYPSKDKDEWIYFEKILCHKMVAFLHVVFLVQIYLAQTISRYILSIYRSTLYIYGIEAFTRLDLSSLLKWYHDPYWHRTVSIYLSRFHARCYRYRRSEFLFSSLSHDIFR